MSSAVMLDFDGTITLRDTSELVLRRFADDRWQLYDEMMDRGEISLEECMQRQFAMVHVPPQEIIEFLDGVAVARAGLNEFLGSVLVKDSGVTILSAGLDFYIEHFMARACPVMNIKKVTGRTSWNDGSIQFAFPAIRNKGAADFKQDEVIEARKKHDRIFYVGDGSSDYNAAKISDHVFTVRGSRLDIRFIDERRPHGTFSDFYELENKILNLL